MSCLIQTWEYNCNTPADGGVEFAKITDKENVDSFSVDSATGLIDALAFDETNEVFDLEFEPYTAVFQQVRAEGENLINRQITDAQVISPTQAVFNALQAYKDCRCPLVVITKEFSGAVRIWGHEDGNRFGVRLGAVEHNSGATLTDINNVTVSFTSPWKEFARQLDAATAASLTP
jgi:hypothetical protein